jgi:hypothetical protein
LDFARQGFTAVDQISGQMRTGWRLDMRAPYRLMRAASGADNLLVTEADGAALTGVELRAPIVNLATVARIEKSGGAMPASGWNERFDHVDGVLNLPPGHRLFAAFGADSAPESWIERWGLLDLFLLSLTSVIALRLFGWTYAAVTFATITLVHQDNRLLAWLILLVLVAAVSMRAAPAGWPRTLSTMARNILLGALLVVSVPFAVAQLRFAFYPQLAELAGHALQQPVGVAKSVEYMRAGARAALAPPNYAPSPEPMMQAVGSIAAAGTAASVGSTRIPLERFAPGTLVQAGPGIPNWRYAAFSFNWSGPVDAAQTVHFVILPPWLVGLWRVLSVALLAVLCTQLLRGNLDLKARWQRLFSRRAPAAVTIALALVCALVGTAGHAYSTPDKELLTDLKTRLTRPPKCVPTCAEIMAARVLLTPKSLDASLDVSALSSVAVALPTAGQRFDLDTITVDGLAVPGVYRDGDQQIWIALKPGAHLVKLSGSLPAADSIQVQFPQVPRVITVSGEGWDVSGVNAGRLLGNTIELLRRRMSGHEADASQGGAQLAPYVRVRREFALDLNWSVQTIVQRLAPDRGGITLQIPLLAGESVLSNGIETKGGTSVLVGFDSDATEFTWHSGLSYRDTLTLTAAVDKPWSEAWVFRVSPAWHAEFAGVPAVMPENLQSGDWTFEYFPRAGETLTLTVSRPSAAKGDTLAVDTVLLEYQLGKRSTNALLQFGYRSTRGDRHVVKLPPAVRVTSVSVDGATVPVQTDKDELPLALLPGAHRVEIRWQSDDEITSLTRPLPVDLRVPSSNVGIVMRLPLDRWVLCAGGSGVGPAILYWGELIVLCVFAVALGRSRRAPLRSHEWLILGLGLSTFSWSVLLLFAVWIFAMSWREELDVQQMSKRKFNLLQLALILLSLAAVVSLIAAIPFGLLANPDMGIAGSGQRANELSWFNDRAPGVLPRPWVFSLSLWWYKALMLAWALWLAFALVRWLPIAWRALGAGGFWRKTPRPPASSKAEQN